MTTHLAEEIHMARAFSSLEEEAYLNLARTTDRLTYGLAEVLKPEALSPATFNVLRILRGAGPTGMPCGEIGGRMLTRVPDVTRLVDRLETRRLVARNRQRDDRRVVRVAVTPAGLALLERLDQPLRQVHLDQLGHMPPARLRTMIELLENARESASAKRAEAFSEGCQDESGPLMDESGPLSAG